MRHTVADCAHVEICSYYLRVSTAVAPTIMTFPRLHVSSLLRLSCLLALLVLAGACSPRTPSPGDAVITITDPWVRQPAPGAPVAGAYLHLTNPGVHDDRLLAVETPAAGRVEIHEMQTQAGMMQMRKLEHGLALPAGETTHLAPGGLHLMLITPKEELAAGAEVSMTLKFERAPAQTVVFAVRSLMDAGKHHHGHEGHQ